MADPAEFITINSVKLAIRGAWLLVDPTPFLGQGSYRGSDRVIAGEAGRLARTRVLDAMDLVVPMYVFGVNNQGGTAHANARLGLRNNLEYLRANLLPPYTGSDSVAITHTFSDASTRTGLCIVNELQVAGALDTHVGKAAVVSLDVTIIGGKLAAA